MNARSDVSIPEPTLRRLPRYYNYLKGLRARGRDVVSCTHIGNDLGLEPPQIRKDLAVTGIRGLPKVGYQVDQLLKSIEDFFGWNQTDEAFLVGVGHLGHALMNYRGLSHCGFRIVAAFDNSQEIVGQVFAGVEVLPVSKLTSLCRRMHINVGVITTPAEAAQETADMLIAGGVKGIWNFAPAEIRVPEGVIVQNENLAAGLSVLCKRLQMLQLSDDFSQEVTE